MNVYPSKIFTSWFKLVFEWAGISTCFIMKIQWWGRWDDALVRWRTRDCNGFKRFVSCGIMQQIDLFQSIIPLTPVVDSYSHRAPPRQIWDFTFASLTTSHQVYLPMISTIESGSSLVVPVHASGWSCTSKAVRADITQAHRYINVQQSLLMCVSVHLAAAASWLRVKAGTSIRSTPLIYPPHPLSLRLAVFLDLITSSR